jgi:alanine racemase
MRPAWLEVDLAAYRRNLAALAAYSGRPVLAVVKANAYGHGLVPVGRAALQVPQVAGRGVAGLGVALPEEGAELRAGGVGGRVIVLGLSLEDQADLLVEADLECVAVRPAMLAALDAAAARAGRVARVHVKVDTGMARVGLEPDEALPFCEEVRARPHLELAGLLTHFANAEAPDDPATRAQWAAFAPLAEAVGRWTPRPALHAANGVAGLLMPQARLDWVRAGLVSYGVPPRPLPVALEPVAALRARVVQVKDVPAGRAVSYGGTWVAPRPSRLALVPVGYADGYPWSLSNRADALIAGRRVPLRGRVCMDQFVLDVTDLAAAGITVDVGAEVTLLGGSGDERITAGELAERAGTLPYEILTGLAARLPRVYREAPEE